MHDDFREIGHSGGKITFTVRTDESGHSTYGIGYSSSRPVPMVMIAVYAIPQGIPVSNIAMGGLGDPWSPPPFPGCYPVMIQSDSEGHFGHHCPRCGGYWRSGPWPRRCPYCNLQAEGFQFLSEAQLRYVRHYCDVLTNALSTIENGEVHIDMDAVADAAGKGADEKPAFFVAEESQQNKYNCCQCEEFNDILGRFGYCSLCGTRNDIQEFEEKTIPAIRHRLNAGATPQDAVRDGVAAFDSFVGQYARQLAEQVAMTFSRRRRLTTLSFHDLDEVRSSFRHWFDVDLCHGMKEVEIDAVRLMFLRRHLYEHNGGEVDQKYLDKSGDKTVRLKQVIRETQEAAHSLLGSVVKMARNLHVGFHELIPVDEGPIRAFDEKRKRFAGWESTS